MKGVAGKQLYQRILFLSMETMGNNGGVQVKSVLFSPNP